MAYKLRMLRICQSCIVGAKVLYDCRKTLKIMALKTSLREFKLVKYFLVSGAMIDVDNLRQLLPEDCLKYVKPPPERKMLVVANLKMNGSMKTLKDYSQCLTKSIACVDGEKAKNNSIRNYSKQIYPDNVDIVIAPPYPYIESFSNWLRKDCSKCQNCQGCKDCSRCKDIIDCPDCNNCKCNNCEECCQNKCLSFCTCDPNQSCEQSGESNGCSVCECDNCDICEYCQTCFKNDCDDCATCIQTAGQNSFAYLSGGMPGEVTPRQLRELGARWVIIGSSERRELFKENDELLAHKLRCALMARMQVVYCISDSCLEDPCEIRKQLLAVIPKIGTPGDNNNSGNPHKTQFKITKKRIKGKEPKEYLEILGLQDWSKVAIAYEPMQAIKNNELLTPEEAEEKCKQIREIIETTVSEEAACRVRILYGGPVNPDSAPDYADMPSIDGFMLGCSAFKIDELIPIANAWFIKNRQDISEIETILGRPDPCIKEPIEEEEVGEKREVKIMEPVDAEPKKFEPRCGCTADSKNAAKNE